MATEFVQAEGLVDEKKSQENSPADGSHHESGDPAMSLGAQLAMTPRGRPRSHAQDHIEA